MYNSFFGFKERPFQLVPNPAYLFLSRCHEEALAHLTYALSQGDGFVEITGEVGTGKTTLCRAFLENLDHNTEAAYIFNPKLDSLQLLKTINDEFGLSSEADNIKDLIDTLNDFLIRRKAEGKKVILVIDEAQNLSKDVLEQLRLLSNLETSTSKLIQIVLVGQPELGDMLDSYELRQLGQRITLSYTLNPLNFRETRDYIRHRLQVASQKPGVKFTWPAIRTIYRYSGGIPRLINIACDRSLLTAFGLDRRKVTAGIASASIRELAGRGEVRRYSLAREKRGTLIAALIVCVPFPDPPLPALGGGHREPVPARTGEARPREKGGEGRTKGAPQTRGKGTPENRGKGATRPGAGEAPGRCREGARGGEGG